MREGRTRRARTRGPPKAERDSLSGSASSMGLRGTAAALWRCAPYRFSTRRDTCSAGAEGGAIGAGAMPSRVCEGRGYAEARPVNFIPLAAGREATPPPPNSHLPVPTLQPRFPWERLLRAPRLFFPPLFSRVLAHCAARCGARAPHARTHTHTHTHTHDIHKCAR
jgi:hypothetical protein